MNRQDELRIVLDWGTSKLRAFLVSGAAEVREHICTDRGIRHMLPGGRTFPYELASLLAPWYSKFGYLPIVASGMVGSRQGWCETPYIEVPADCARLASQTRSIVLENNNVLTILPGVSQPSSQPFPDVMRGEETQLMGIDGTGLQVVVVPGTHSKWAKLEDRSLLHFQTFVTGEMFELISSNSFVASDSSSGSLMDWESYHRGVDAAILCPETAGGLLAKLFSLRTGRLTKSLEDSEVRSYLSGLLVGTEFIEAGQCRWHAPGDELGIIAEGTLAEAYSRVARRLDLRVKMHPYQSIVRGALQIFATQ